MRVVLANRSASVARGLSLLLMEYAGFQVVAEVSDLSEVVPSVGASVPDLVLIDSDFPDVDLEGLLARIKAASPQSPIVVLTASLDRSHLEAAMRAGATAFVSVDNEPEQLVRTLKLAAEGHVLVSTPMVEHLSDLLSNNDPPASDQVDVEHDLSPRELEVLNLVVSGGTNLEIAETLVITENTVKVHMRNILAKLQLRNRQQLTAYAYQTGLVDPVSPSPPDSTFSP